MACAERDRLMAECNRLALRYADNALSLSRSVVITSKSEYERVRTAIEKLRAEYEQIRELLDDHRQSHGC